MSDVPEAEGDDVGSDGGDVPSEAAGRLGRAAFSSGLTVPDFAACLHMGLRPVGLVQGFCVMRWAWYRGSTWGVYNYSGDTLTSYTCPHYATDAAHRQWGSNYEFGQMNQAWSHGYDTALLRMLEEAKEAGAHGVIGVVDTTSHLIDNAIREFHLLGTAVVFEDRAPSKDIWSTYLAGQRLAKLIEAGFMPVSIVATSETVRIWEVCTTEILLRGVSDGYGRILPGDEITQLSDAHMSVRRGARDHIRARLGHDALHGARLETEEHEIGEGFRELTCTLRGTRVHQFKDVDPLPPPIPTVRLT